jgi:hypothetical protein
MTLEPELWEKVMDRFPKLEKERTCRLERELRQQARMSFYKRLYEQYSETKILETKRENSEVI